MAWRSQLFAVGLTAVATLLITFAYHIVTIRWFGASSSVDAFYAGSVVPLIIVSALTGPLPNILLPHLSMQSGEHARDTAWRLCLYASVVLLLTASLMALTAPAWVPWTTPGFESSIQGVAVATAQISCIGMALSCASVPLLALLQARGWFVRAEASGTVAAVAAIAFLIGTADRFGILAAAWGLLIKSLAQFLTLAWMAGTTSRKALFQREDNLVLLWQRFQPVFLANLYYKSDALVDRILLSWSPAGSLTLFQFGQQLYRAAATVAARAAVQPAIPELARIAASGHRREFDEIFRARRTQIVLGSCAAFLLLVLVGEPVLGRMLALRDHSIEQAHALWLLLIAMGGMALIGPLGALLTASLHAAHIVRAPSLASSLAFTLSLPLRIGAFWLLGSIGLAGAVSVYYLMGFIAVWWVGRHALSEHFRVTAASAGAPRTSP